MATQVIQETQRGPAPRVPSARHRVSLGLSILLVLGVLLAVAFYGFSYYRLPVPQRVGNPLHAILRPSGLVGLRLGQLGFVVFVLVYFYSIRKRVTWLKKIGNSRHWLDFHMLLGVAGPLLITLHSSFKFHGIAGIAFWIMWTVVASGVVGRYFYGQIPRRLNAAEMSLKEMEAACDPLSARLAFQNLVTREEMSPLFRLPGPEEVQAMSLFGALWKMMVLDLTRPFRVSRLRRRAMGPVMLVLSLGGLLPLGNRDLEDVISAARRQSWLLMKINFLGKAQEVFHLWHIVHRPFSYSFAVLVLLHTVAVLLLGYY